MHLLKHLCKSSLKTKPLFLDYCIGVHDIKIDSTSCQFVPITQLVLNYKSILEFTEKGYQV